MARYIYIHIYNTRNSIGSPINYSSQSTLPSNLTLLLKCLFYPSTHSPLSLSLPLSFLHTLSLFLCNGREVGRQWQPTHTLSLPLNTQIHIHANTHRYIYIYTHTNTPIYIYIHTHIYIYLYTQTTHGYAHDILYIYTHTHT